MQVGAIGPILAGVNAGNMRRVDAPNHTRDEVRQHLQHALELVDELNTPDDLRGHMFDKAVDLLAGKQILWEQPQQVAVNLGQLLGQ